MRNVKIKTQRVQRVYTIVFAFNNLFCDVLAVLRAKFQGLERSITSPCTGLRA